MSKKCREIRNKLKSKTTEATEEERTANQIQVKKHMQVLTWPIFGKFEKCEKNKVTKDETITKLQKSLIDLSK